MHDGHGHEGHGHAGHGHGPHDHPAQDAAFWDAMYRHRTAPRDAAPSPLLAEVVPGLAPGVALDVGCGEGADAIWLARLGWRVTGVDISAVALDRARAADADGRVTWVQADVLAWEPPADGFDLVSLHYVHVAPERRAALFGRLARAVRPGGQLLVVAHHHSDLGTSVGRPALPDLFFTAEGILDLLAPGRWEVVAGGTRPRAATDREGRPITIDDAVLQARRIA